MTLAQLRALASLVGFPDPALAAAVAMAESHIAGSSPPQADPSALGDAGTSYGLWQIHLPDHPEYAGADLYDPLTNARAAFAISRSGTYWHPWSTFNSGAYASYYQAAAAASSVGVALAAIGVAGVVLWRALRRRRS